MSDSELAEYKKKIKIWKGDGEQYGKRNGLLNMLFRKCFTDVKMFKQIPKGDGDKALRL